LAKKRAISSLEGVITELFEELVLVLLVESLIFGSMVTASGLWL
jgi:hypothetical protein